MESSFLLQLRALCYGGLIAFFVTTLVRLIPAMRKQRNRNGRFLMLILAITMVLLVVKNIIRFCLDLDLQIHPEMETPAYYVLPTILEMMAIPFMGVSLMAIVRLSPTRFTEVVLEQIPLIICLILVFFIQNDSQDQLMIRMAGLYVFIYSLLVIVYVHIGARRYKAILNDTYANTHRRGVTWVLTTLYILVGLLVSWFILRYLYQTELNGIIYNLLSLVPWIFYSYRLLLHDFNTKEMEAVIAGVHEDELEDDENSAAVKAWQEPAFGDAVRDFCTKKENFTNTELSIVDVARAVGTNRTYVSRWCKEQGMDFSGYIANIRVAYAERLLSETDYSIIDVAAMAGFSSPRSFRAAFVQRTKVNPSEYRATKIAGSH